MRLYMKYQVYYIKAFSLYVIVVKEVFMGSVGSGDLRPDLESEIGFGPNSVSLIRLGLLLLSRVVCYHHCGRK